MMRKSPLILLVGNDSYLIESELNAIKKEILDPATRDFNYQKFSAKTERAETIIDSCQSLPMMSEARLVVVTEAETIRKDDEGGWLAYFEKPSPTTCLVLMAGKIDRRLKLWQTAAKRGVLRELKVPYARELPHWIATEAQKRGLEIPFAAAQALTDSIGENPMALIQALEKLSLYAAPRKKIELADVEAVGGSFLARNIFDFTAKVGEGRFAEAENLLGEVMTAGEPPVRILFMLARHFRLLMMAREGMEGKKSESELAGEMGVHPFFVKDYLSQARKVTASRLKKIYRHLLAADRAAKSSPLSTRFILDQFLAKACLG